MATVAKDLRQKRAKLVEDARAVIDRPNPGAAAFARFDAMLAESDRIKAQIDRIERADEVDRFLNSSLVSRARASGRSAAEQYDLEEGASRAFNKFMRFGAEKLTDEELRVLNNRRPAIQNSGLVEGTGTAGGYTVPTGFYRKLIDAQLAYGGMMAPGVSTIVDTATGNTMPIPTDNDTGNVGFIVGENVQVTDVDAPFGQVSLGAYMYTSGIQKVSLQLLQDSAFDLESWLSEKLGVRIARAANAHFTTGTGTGQPQGVLGGATLGTTGATGQTTSIIYDDLINLEHAVDPAYRKKARFMMADSALKEIKKLKDSIGRPLWLPGLSAKEPDTINGYPYVINQSMPAMGPSVQSVLFGDFSNYYVRRVSGAIAMRLTERYADFGMVAFLIWQRFDGRMVDAGTHPIAYYQNSAT